jgi:hypothetical protein
LISAADEVRVVESDVSPEARLLDAAGRARLSEVASSLQPYRQDPNANPLPTPYPDYRLEIATGATVVRVFLSRDHVVAMWQTDAFGQAEFSDRDGRLWALLQGLAPAPDPANLEGPRRLFSYGKARAGFNTPVEVGAGWVPVVVRCLLAGTPGAGGPPVGDKPVELSFSESSAGAAASCVLLYEDGFVLDGRFYEAPGVLQAVGTNMVNAGSW